MAYMRYQTYNDVKNIGSYLEKSWKEKKKKIIFQID